MPRLWMGMAYKAVLHWNLSCLRQLWHQFLCATCLILLAAYKRFKTECNITQYYQHISVIVSDRSQNKGGWMFLVMGDAMMWLILLSLLILFWPPSKLWNLGPRCFRNQEGQSCRAQNDSYYSYFNLFHWSCWLSYTFYIFLSFLIQFNKNTQHTLLAVAFPDPHKQANPTSISHICTICTAS